MSDDDYLWDASGEPDADVERLEASLGGLKFDRPAPEVPARTNRLWMYAAAATLLFGVVYGTYALTNRALAPAGPQTYAISELNAGSWIETGASRARIKVADIGYVDVSPKSRIKAVRSGATEHRLHLERGRIHAKINAPPRLFIVETPSSVAVDQGCEYTLEVDKEGNGLLRVTLGWVNLELDSGLSEVPAGAACESRKDAGLGVPYFEDATPAFRGALSSLTFGAGSNPTQSFDTILTEARTKDSLTLWHLLRESKAQMIRSVLTDRLEQLVPLPTGVTALGIYQADEQMLAIYEEEIQQTWWE